jgi:hypothetical protein
LHSEFFILREFRKPQGGAAAYSAATPDRAVRMAGTCQDAWAWVRSTSLRFMSKKKRPGRWIVLIASLTIIDNQSKRNLELSDRNGRFFGELNADRPPFAPDNFAATANDALRYN